MNFGERLTIVRKRRGLSQADMGKTLEIQSDAYGRYERNEVKPNINIATGISKALGVSLDYLVGNINTELDMDTLKKIEDISTMSSEDQNHVFSLIDAFIAKTKLQGLI